MRIDHVAIWTADLERLKIFYERRFGAHAGEKYVNPRRQFESYFLTFPSGGRLEIMRLPDLAPAPPAPSLGYAHLALALGSSEAVDRLTTELAAQGVPVVDGPRHTGDGYYESVVLDPDGNQVELTV